MEILLMQQKSWGNDGQSFCFLYAELRGTIVFAYEKKWWDYLVCAELFLEIHSAFCEEELPAPKTVEDILRSYVNDYCQDMMEQRIAEGVDPELDFATKIIMESDLEDLRYLYRYGEYVSGNETGVALFLNSLSQEKLMIWRVPIQKDIASDLLIQEKTLQKRKP